MILMANPTSKRPLLRSINRILCASIVALGAAVVCIAQTEPPKAQAPTRFRIGEKLSYTISFNKMASAGTAELFVASRGKLAGVDVVELHSRARTVDLVAAAFLAVDETRTVYADPETGLPVYTVKSSNIGMPRDAVANYLRDGSTNYDLLTLIYRAREAAGSGTFNFVDGEQVHTATFVPTGNAVIKTEAGIYETIISNVQSSFLTPSVFRTFKYSFRPTRRIFLWSFASRLYRGPLKRP
jgi:hypothetical protein